LDSEEKDDRTEAVYGFLLSSVFHQYTLYPATPLVIPFIIEALQSSALAERDNGFGQPMKVELLGFLDVCAKCGQRAMRGRPFAGAPTVESALLAGREVYKLYSEDLHPGVKATANSLLQFCDSPASKTQPPPPPMFPVILRRTVKVVGILVLIPLVLLLSKCAVVHFQHDADARQLLTDLRKVPLPQGSHLVCERTEVGNYFSSTGDATDIFACRVFTTDLPAKDLSEFFASYINGLLKGASHRDIREISFWRADEVPPLFDLPLDSILKQVPQAERSHAYILYSANRCEEDGIWDGRGW
jgi:hypothetical protein